MDEGQQAHTVTYEENTTMPTNSRTAGPKAGDLTGRQRAAAAKQNAEEQAARREEMAMISAQKEIELRDEVVDLSNPDQPTTLKDDEVKDPRIQGTDGLEDEIVEAEVRDAALEETEVDTKEKLVVVRVNEDVEMTFAGAEYKMEQGPKYRLPRHIADHLDERGYIWH